ncbi:cytochrome P450 [Nocardia sp. BMG51109]|uniref:cytochrome P450 n=1 Tax=Nocardia sp. BMG51109 TaxID=1056816 RepID=UPI0004669341|nr:cytochrome P450 [Nocardia sp. BMG51109]
MDSTVISSSAPDVTADGPVIALYTPEFVAEPPYGDMRRTFGSLAPVELSPGVRATLVLDYPLAVKILHDEDHFPADPGVWQRGVPADCPLMPMLGGRPNVIHTAGHQRQRYRAPIAESLNNPRLLHRVHKNVETVAVPLIDMFSETGRAELVSQYAQPIMFGALNQALGCPQEIGERAAAGAAAILDSSGDDAAQGNETLEQALSELIERKRAEPGDDITSAIMAHAEKLNNAEVLHQLVLLYCAGIDPSQHWMTAAWRKMMTDSRFGGDLISGAQSTRDALDEVLFTDPPMSNYCVTYPRQPMLIDGVWLPAHQPVVISLAACNASPDVTGNDLAGLVGNRSHLAWGAGPHACPARQLAYLIVQDATDQLLDVLPEIALAVPETQLTYRPGPFHRALAALPVTFPPTPRSVRRSPQ